MRRPSYKKIGMLSGFMLAVWGISMLLDGNGHKHYELPGDSVSDVQYLGFDRVVKQVGAVDCGPAALKMILDHHGVRVSLDTLSHAAGLTGAGVSLLGLRHAAARFGLHGTGWRLSLQELRRQPLPALVKVGGCHFAVVDRMNDDRIVLLDPKEGEVHLSATQFEAVWDGVALTVKPEKQDAQTSHRTITNAEPGKEEAN